MYNTIIDSVVKTSLGILPSQLIHSLVNDKLFALL